MASSSTAVTSGTGHVEGTLLLDVGLDDVGDRLPHLVLDVDLLRLVTTERRAQERDDASIHVLLALVAGAEVQQDSTDLLALGLLEGAVLHECAERRQTSTQTGHDERRGVLGGQLHDGGLDADGDLRADGQGGQVAGGLTVARAALAVDPVDHDDHERDRVGGDGLRGRDRVLATLEGRDELDEVVERGARRRELLQDVAVGLHVDLGALLELLRAFAAAQGSQLRLLDLVGGVLGELLVEALGDLAEDVEVLNQGLVHGAGLQHVGVVAVGDLDEVVAVEAVEVDEFLDLLGVVVRVDAERLANVVGNTGVAKVELDVEDVTVVVGAKAGLSTICLLEGEGLGGGLHAANLQVMLDLDLGVANEAGSLDYAGELGGSIVSWELSPRGWNLDLAQALVQSVLELLGRALLGSREVLADIDDSVGSGNAQESQLNQELEVALQSGGERGVEDEELQRLLEDSLPGGRGKSLLEVVVLKAWQSQEELTTRLRALQNVDILEDLLLTNVYNIGLIDGIWCLDGLLGAADVGADETTLDQVVELANNRRRVDTARVVNIPEGVLLDLTGQGGRGGGYLGTNELLDSVSKPGGGQNLRRSVLDIADDGCLSPLAGERNSSEHIRVQDGLDGGIVDISVCSDLAPNSNTLDGCGQNIQESLLHEGAVQADADSSNLLALSRELRNNLVGDLRLDAAENNNDDLGIRVSKVLERLVVSAKLAIEGVQQVKDLGAGVGLGVQALDVLGQGVVSILDTGLAEGVDNPQGLAGCADTVVDVQGRQDRSQQGRQQRHVLGLVGRRAAHKTQTKVIGNLECAAIVGDKTLFGTVVRRGDVGDERTGGAVQKRQLVKRGTQVTQTQARGEQSLGDVSLGQIEILREDVSEGECACACSGLERQDRGGIAMDVGLAGTGPLADGDVEVESLRRVGEDLVRQLVGDLLDKELGSDIGRAGDLGQGHQLAEGQAGRDLLEHLAGLGLGRRGAEARTLLLLQMHEGIC
ncbi:hypothetical protein VPNG_04432 [Cytospora leucostoma]|uniref:Uncharacterized protein n=1 Tax=Cytospora leucostoma TaxID=1230097 RepID=A0A423XBR2_9PEZI|nr:hypothetical protein VPNG_04432 [Cytospora leucostoma]